MVVLRRGRVVIQSARCDEGKASVQVKDSRKMSVGALRVMSKPSSSSVACEKRSLNVDVNVPVGKSFSGGGIGIKI